MAYATFRYQEIVTSYGSWGLNTAMVTPLLTKNATWAVYTRWYVVKNNSQSKAKTGALVYRSLLYDSTTKLSWEKNVKSSGKYFLGRVNVTMYFINSRTTVNIFILVYEYKSQSSSKLTNY